jgi:SAM-dependent methyltransferase
MSRLRNRPDGPILETVAQYYSEKLKEHGPTAQGADWKSEESQLLRFKQLLCVIEDAQGVSLIDYGCGYGALLDYVDAAGHTVASYFGFDVSDTMIASARERHAGRFGCAFTSDQQQLRPSDFVVASGIFNVRLGHSDGVWRDYVERILERVNALSRQGFAFNMLSTYSEADKRRADLHYADPCQIFDLCKRRFSAKVALLHDYPLFEFTIIVRK